MALAETARLIASLELKDLFSKQIGAAEKSLGKFDTKLDQTQTRAFRAGQQIGTGIRRTAALAAGAIGFLASQVALGLNSLVDLEKITTQTNAVLKSTKGAAGESAQAIRSLAEKYEGLNAIIDDKVIQSGENVLLTFTNIRKQAFEPALNAALNLSTAMGQDLQTSVVQIGKALNDPVKGLTSLQRIGVAFTSDQKKQIKALVEANDVYGAQKIIIGELDKEFGGSFLAQGNTTAGKVAKVKDAIEDLQKALATALLPAIGKVADAVTKFLADPKVVASISRLGEKIAGLFSDKNLAAGADFLKGAFQTFQAAAPFLEAAAKATLGFVQAAVSLFKSLPAPLQGLLAGGFALNKLTGGLVTNIAGGLADLIGKSRGATPANPVFVSDVSGGLGGVAGAAGKAGLLGTLLTKLGGLALVGGGLAGIGAGAATGGPAGAGIAALGGAGTIAGGALLAGPLGAIAGSLLAVAKTFGDVTSQNSGLAKGIGDSVKAEIAGGASLADLQKSLDAVNTGINDIQSNPLNVLVAGDALDQLRQQKSLLEQQLAQAKANPPTPNTAGSGRTAGSILDRGGREQGFSELAGKIKDDRAIVTETLRVVQTEFTSLNQTLRRSNKPDEIKHALEEAVKLITSGRGGAETTRHTLQALQAALKNTHDPKLQSELRAAIAKVERKLPAREFAAKQFAKADAILKSNEKSGRKITDLQAIEKSLKDRGLPHAADEIKKRIDAAKAAQVAAEQATARTVKEKKLSVNLTTVVNTTVSVRDQIRREHQIARTGTKLVPS